MCVRACVRVCVRTEAGLVGSTVDLQSGAADDQVCVQCVSFIGGDLRVPPGHVQLQVRQVRHLLT